jgi:hypothetical protein
MSVLQTLRKLVLGETWLLPVGVGCVVALSALVLEPLLDDAWTHAGGFLLLAGVLGVLVAAVGRSARGRRA